MKGVRAFSTARDAKGKAVGCVDLPERPEDPTDCPVLHPGVIVREADAELGRRGITTVGWGLGRCRRADGSPIFFDDIMSAGVNDWKHAEELVQIISELLDRYDVAGTVGAEVRGIWCGSWD